MIKKFKVFRITLRYFYDLAEWGVAAQEDPRSDTYELIEAIDFDTYEEGMDWIREYAPLNTDDQYYVVMPVYRKIEMSQM